MLRSPLEDVTARNEVALHVAQLSEPADLTWLMARVAALLSPYYTGDVPHGVRVMEAEDWAAALGEYPQWAVTKAVRWWKSEANPDRRKKPLEGDIAARARFEIGVVIVARKAVTDFDNGLRPPQPAIEAPRKPLDRSGADEILRKAGFAVKRMPYAGEDAA